MTSRQLPPSLDAAWDEGTEVSDPPMPERARTAFPLRAPVTEVNTKKTMMIGVQSLRPPAAATPPAASPVVAAPAARAANARSASAPLVAAPEPVHEEPVSARVARAATVMGSGASPRIPARVVAEVSYEVDVPSDDSGDEPTEVPTQVPIVEPIVAAAQMPAAAPVAATVAAEPAPNHGAPKRAATPHAHVPSPVVTAMPVSKRPLDPVAAAAAAVIAARRGSTEPLPEQPPKLARASEPAFETSRVEMSKRPGNRSRYIALAALAFVCICAGVAAALVTHDSKQSASAPSAVAMTSEPTAQPTRAAEPSAAEQVADETAPAEPEMPAAHDTQAAAAEVPAGAEPDVAAAEAPVGAEADVAAAEAPVAPAKTAVAKSTATKPIAKKSAAKKSAATKSVATKSAPARTKRVTKPAPKRKKSAACSELSCL